MAWMKAYPKAHAPFYFFILVNFIISRLRSSSETDRRLCQMLAFKALAGAASDTEDKIGKINTGRVITTQEDLLLLLRVYKDQGKYQEALDILEDPQRGFASSIGKSSWELVLEMLDFQGLCNKWESQWCNCLDILKGSRPSKFRSQESKLQFSFGERGDDWKIWKTFITATSKLTTDQPDILNKVEDFIIRFSDPKSRNASLASMLLQCRSAKHVNIIISQINLLKTNYYLLLIRSSPQHRLDLAAPFIATCLKLYKASTLLNLQLPQSDRSPADDVLVLAAMVLIQIYRQGQKNAVLKSIVILEHLLSQSRHNYEALLILVQLYAYLGLGSLALDRYSRLSIKNIQHASMSWALFTRLSTIHPQSVRASHNSHHSTIDNPTVELNQALKWHRGSTLLTDKSLALTLDNRQYRLILGLLEAQETIQNGMSKAILQVESNRLDHLNGHGDKSKNHPIFEPLQLRDNRDKSAFPNYQPSNQPSFQEILPTAAPKKENEMAWLAQEVDLTDLWDQLGEEDLDSINVSRSDQPNNNCAKQGAGLTPSESRARIIFRLIQDIIAVSNRPSGKAGDDEELLKQISLLRQRLYQYVKDPKGILAETGLGFGCLRFSEGRYLPLWYAFHGCFIRIEVTLFVSRCMKCVAPRIAQVESSKRATFTEQVNAVEEVCDRIRSELETRAENEKEYLSSSGFGRFLELNTMDTSDAIGREVAEGVGLERVTAICSMVQESYVEAFDGVARTTSR
ncbi:uncharacterized protein KY384_009110 [Bacidia gigantensis]|uniref:uncharacterized protein n=1 Tax=Bacidia gigantensis TaxID=2732470 RepID=UPI001D03C837|nr:uncharacterized protein KY384_009110 [Bacidia gigantensis]KAG8525466.1 hypothetical protein KY384_009110 [Bacidia gigantensis]